MPNPGEDSPSKTDSVPATSPTAVASSGAGAGTISAPSVASGPGASGGSVRADRDLRDIRIALICQSNLNRSMEAHLMLSKKGYNVRSFGAGTKVRLPGEAANKPNIYDFGTPYDFIYNDLKTKNAARYARTGMLDMIDRNRKIKPAPERWQDSKSYFDLVVCYEKRVYETVITDIENRIAGNGNGSGSGSGSGSGAVNARPVHILNLDTTDSHAEAKQGALLTSALVKSIFKADDWEDEITDILDAYEKKNKKTVLHTVLFY